MMDKRKTRAAEAHTDSKKEESAWFGPKPQIKSRGARNPNGLSNFALFFIYFCEERGQRRIRRRNRGANTLHGLPKGNPRELSNAVCSVGLEQTNKRSLDGGGKKTTTNNNQENERNTHPQKKSIAIQTGGKGLPASSTQHHNV
jgi:hypothetical protein